MNPTLIPARVDWKKLSRLSRVIKLTRGGCDWISFESIADCLRAGRLEDVSVPQTETSNHAARIASLIRLLKAGAPLDPMVLNVLPSARGKGYRQTRLTMWFEDGSHRFRAHQYLGRCSALDVVLRGEVAVLEAALRAAGAAIRPIDMAVLA